MRRWLFLGPLGVAWLMAACGSNILIKREDEGAGGAAVSVTASSSRGVGGTGQTSTTVSSTSAGGRAPCVPNTWALDGVHEPVDVILAVESGWPMESQLTSLEINLHPALVLPMEQQGVDVQVIVIANHGSTPAELCIGPPLAMPPGCGGMPGEVAGNFRHYSHDVGPGQGLCSILSTLHGQSPDEFGTTPAGWHTHLRQNALKAFVVVMGSSASCTWNGDGYADDQQAALTFDSRLVATGGGQFGTSLNRRYVVHSMTGIFAPGQLPYLPSEPIVFTYCQVGFFGLGVSYQWLSKGTESLRNSMCENSDLASPLIHASGAIAEQARNRCVMNLPFEVSDPSTVELRFTPDAMTMPQTFSQIGNPANCGLADDRFYIEGQLIKLCPETCDRVKLSPAGTFELEEQCLSE